MSLTHQSHDMTSSAHATVRSDVTDDAAATGAHSSAMTSLQVSQDAQANWSSSRSNVMTSQASTGGFSDCLYAARPTSSLTNGTASMTSPHVQHSAVAPALHAQSQDLLTSPMPGTPAAGSAANYAQRNSRMFSLDSLNDATFQTFSQDASNGQASNYNPFPHLTASLGASMNTMHPAPVVNPYYPPTQAYPNSLPAQQDPLFQGSSSANVPVQQFKSDASNDGTDAGAASANDNRPSPFTFERALTLCKNIKVKDGETSSGSRVSVFLHNRDIWLKFHERSTEMIITKQGRLVQNYLKYSEMSVQFLLRFLKK